MRRLLVSLFMLVLPCAVFAGSAANFVAGQDYQILQTSPGASPSADKQILVQEFFSYGCPWCFKIEPLVEKWLQNKPKTVNFERVPVVFEPGWGIYSKAYYTAKALDIANKMTPALFNAIHEKGLKLDTDADMSKFFVEHGVKQQDFASIYNSSPSVDMEIKRANMLMQSYKVAYIPLFVINGKYSVSLGSVKGDVSKLIQVVNYLIAKEAKS